MLAICKVLARSVMGEGGRDKKPKMLAEEEIYGGEEGKRVSKTRRVERIREKNGMRDS